MVVVVVLIEVFVSLISVESIDSLASSETFWSSPVTGGGGGIGLVPPSTASGSFSLVDLFLSELAFCFLVCFFCFYPRGVVFFAVMGVLWACWSLLCCCDGVGDGTGDADVLELAEGSFCFFDCLLALVVLDRLLPFLPFL